MAKVLSVEIGMSLIYMCEVDYKSPNPRVYKWTTVQTPENTVREDEIVVNEQLISVMREGINAAGIRTKKMVFTMSSPKIASREVVIPFVKENKIASVIRTNASDFFPVDMEQYELGHSIEGTQVNEKGVKQYRVHVLAVPKTIIEGYFQLAKALGGSIEALDYSGNSIFQIVQDQCDTGVKMVVKVGERNTIITIIKDAAIAMQRMIPYGIDEAVASVVSAAPERNLTYMQALNMLLQGKTDASLSYLSNGISRVVDYYNSRNTESPIELTYVTGIGGECDGMAEFLQNALELPVRVLKELEAFRLEKDFKGENVGRYLTCIGASMAPLGFLGERAEKGKKIEKTVQTEDMKRVSILVGAGGVLIAVVLAVVSGINVANVSRENVKLQQRVAELEPVKEIYRSYLQQQYTDTKLNYLYDSTVLPDENLVEFIEELEDKMPASLNVQSFTAGKEGVNMSLTVKDKEEAAKLIQQLRTFDTISTVSVSGISDSGAVMKGEPMEQEGMVSFSVALTYKGASELAAEQLAKEAAAAQSANTENTDNELEGQE